MGKDSWRLWLKIEGGSVGKMDEGSGLRLIEVPWVKMGGWSAGKYGCKFCNKFGGDSG